MSRIRYAQLVAGGTAVAALIYGSLASATPGSGSTSVLLARGTFAGSFDVRRVVSGPAAWETRVEARPGLDVATQAITFQPGGHSGWHSHPGPVFITVVSGAMSFYESDDPSCTPVVRTAGQGFLDTGEHAHLARNETGEPATNLVTYFAPPGAALRIDAPDPGNCPRLLNQPVPPGGLTFAVAGRLVELRWSASPGALDYILEAGSAPGASDLFRGSIGAVLSITTAALPGRYYVRVRARSAAGTSGPSQEVVIDVR